MRAAFESAPCPSLEMVCIIFLTTFFFLGLSPPMFTHSVDLLVFVFISCHCLFTRVSCSVCSGQGTRSSTAWVSSPGRKSKGKKESQKTRGENNNNDRVFLHAGVRGRASALGVETRFTSLRTATRALEPRTPAASTLLLGSQEGIGAFRRRGDPADASSGPGSIGKHAHTPCKPVQRDHHMCVGTTGLGK